MSLMSDDTKQYFKEYLGSLENFERNLDKSCFCMQVSFMYSEKLCTNESVSITLDFHETWLSNFWELIYSRMSYDFCIQSCVVYFFLLQTRFATDKIKILVKLSMQLFLFHCFTRYCDGLFVPVLCLYLCLCSQMCASLSPAIFVRRYLELSGQFVKNKLEKIIERYWKEILLILERPFWWKRLPFAVKA